MRRVLVTGGSGGIGSAVARACAVHGMWPLVGYAHNPQAADDVVRTAGAGMSLRIDLREPIWDLSAAGEVSAVVHCAGMYSPRRRLLAADPRETLELLEVNALGPLRLTQALIEQHAPLEHVIVMLSTAVACRGGGAYALSKATALAMCKLLAGELAPRGIRVHAVVPGWTETPMALAAATASGRSIETIRQDHPEHQLLDPDQIGRLVVELLEETGSQDDSQLILWDLRDAREPIRTTLDHALLFPIAT